MTTTHAFASETRHFRGEIEGSYAGGAREIRAKSWSDIQTTKMRASPSANDCDNSLRHFLIAFQLALTDIRLQYRRSTLGPLWVSATLFAQISVIGLLFSRLFDAESSLYLLHLGTGFIAWTFVVNTLNESTQSLITAGPLIKQVLLPFSVHTMRTMFKNVLLFAHNLVALVPFYFFALDRLNIWMLLALPGFALAVINISWVSIVLAVVSARYRDLPAVISGLLVIAFYVTPILWTVEQLEGTWVKEIVPFNPFFHVVEVFREPLLGQPMPLQSALILCVTAAVGWLVVRGLLAWKSRLIAFWV